MVKLALAIGEGSQLGGSRALLAVDQRTSREAFARLGERVLVYQFADKVFLDFVGSGTVAGVNLTSDGFRLVTVDQYTSFAAPVTGEAELAAPGARRMLRLGDERYEEIIGLARASDRAGAAEAAVQLRDAPSLAVYLAIHDQVLRTWDYRCAVTGRQFEPGPRPHPHLRVVAIQPRERGGPLHVKNYLPMVETAERAWLTGGISVAPGSDFVAVLNGENMLSRTNSVAPGSDFVAVLNRLDPDLLEAMPRSGRLVLPDDEAAWPDPALLSWHFDHVFGLF